MNVKPGAKNYIISDTLTNLNLVASSFKINGKTLAEDAALTTPIAATGSSVTDKATSFSITLNQAWLNTVDTATTVTITYDAILQSTAEIGETGNPNDVKLTWGDNPDDNYDEDEAKVYSAQLNILKTDNDNKALAGATFVLKNKAGKYYKMDNGEVTWVDSAEAADSKTTNAEGKFDTPFSGLGNGTYTFQETVTPDGFNKIPDNDPSLTVNIADDDYTNTNLKKDEATTIINNKGSVLPSTGGIGTTIFYIAGAVLVLGAAAIIIARRKAEQ